MGSNFQVGHASEMFTEEFADGVHTALASALPPSTPLGSPGDCFCLRDQLAWSWWKALQSFAAEHLGVECSVQIQSVDAWQAVYLDAPTERLALPVGGANPVDLATNLSDGEAEVRAAIEEMIAEFGAREGEFDALQVASLRGLLDELNAVFALLGIDPTAAAVEETRRSYADGDDDRIDMDGHVQCACHAWLSAVVAIERRAPLWLVK